MLRIIIIALICCCSLIGKAQLFLPPDRLELTELRIDPKEKPYGKIKRMTTYDMWFQTDATNTRVLQSKRRLPYTDVYNTKGQLIEELYTVPVGSWHYYHTYDSVGRLVSTYDKVNKKRELIDTVSYDDLHKTITRWEYDKGALENKTIYTFNRDNLLVGRMICNKNNEPALESWYEYNADQTLKLQVNRNLKGAALPIDTREFGSRLDTWKLDTLKCFYEKENGRETVKWFRRTDNAGEFLFLVTDNKDSSFRSVTLYYDSPEKKIYFRQVFTDSAGTIRFEHSSDLLWADTMTYNRRHLMLTLNWGGKEHFVSKYKYDKMGNWIEQTDIHITGKTIANIAQRDIEYFPADK